MFDTYRKLLDLLSARERRNFYLLLGMILVMGFVEMVGVASIVPFMLVLADPSVVETNARLAWIYDTLGFTDPQRFMVFLGFTVFAIVVFGLAFKGLTQYAVYRFTMLRGYTISSRMLHGYLSQPYTWFLNRHSADLGANVLGDVQKVVMKALMPAMKFLTYIVVVAALVLLLVAVRPVVALSAALVLGGTYAILYLSVRKYLGRIGAERQKANQKRFQVANEALGGVKDVKLLGLEPHFLRRFRTPAERVARADAMSAIIGDVPRYVLEAVAFGALLAFVMVLLITNDGSLAAVVPILAIYAFAAIRIFPALQRVYNSVAQMRFAKPTLDKLHEDFQSAAAVAREKFPAPSGPAMPLKETLALENVHYNYPMAERAALRGLSLEIPARTTVGIVGGTGAGKTTAVDIVLGLLTPQDGAVRVDGTAIDRTNLAAWQRAIGYVPQHIFLTDDTVAANIAFGRETIDREAVERAAKVAELHDFVMGEMPQGYDTFVGERGVRLSGGQRQRIGIARALYHDPEVLILDEATSALDNLTERAVMDAVHNLGNAKTIIMIAHRLSTVQECDMIFMLEHGQVVAQGRYDELIETNRKFRALAGA